VALVLAEACLLTAVGGIAGLGLGLLLVGRGDPTGGLLAAFYVPPRQLVAGIGFVLLLGLASGLLPAVRALRLRIVDALRRS